MSSLLSSSTNHILFPILPHTHTLLLTLLTFKHLQHPFQIWNLVCTLQFLGNNVWLLQSPTLTPREDKNQSPHMSELCKTTVYPTFHSTDALESSPPKTLKQGAGRALMLQPEEICLYLPPFALCVIFRRGLHLSKAHVLPSKMAKLTPYSLPLKNNKTR